MLYREITAGAFSAWTGEPIPMVLTVPVFENGVQTGSKEVQDNVSLPLNIEALWADQALAAYGLFRPAEAMPVPDGKLSTGEHVERVEGVVRFVHELEDAPVIFPPLTPRQLWRAAYDSLQMTKEDVVASIDASAMTDSEKKLAKIDIECASSYLREDATVVAMAALMGFAEAEFDSLWLWAASQP